MSFIADDEHIVLVDYATLYDRPLTGDDLRRARDCGVRSVMLYLNWHDIEKERGHYDWSSIDPIVERIRRAGLKAIVKNYLYQIPLFLPESWYERDERGFRLRNVGTWNYNGDIGLDHCGVLSPWHPDAWAYHLGFVEQVCGHFASPDVLCINIAPANGEAINPGANCFHDESALESFRAFVGDDQATPGQATPGTPTLDWLRRTLIPAQVETQRVYVRHYGEYWTMLHHAFETIPSTGNWLIDDLYTELKRQFPLAEHWGMCYTVFRPGETRGLWGPEQDVKRYGLNMLVAAEGAVGLRLYTHRAISMGVRGMFCGPLAPYLGYAKTEDWMFDNLAWSIREWEAAR